MTASSSPYTLSELVVFKLKRKEKHLAEMRNGGERDWVLE